jgi:type IV pilus assembly protein PilO
MSLQETIDSLGNLDPDNIGSWPILIKVILWLLAMSLAAGGVYHFKLSESLVKLEEKRTEEEDLMRSYEDKAFQAANLELLKAQMVEMESSFGALVRQLPSDTEVPGLLEDISQLGVESGLEFNSIGLGSEQNVEFYSALPIKINVEGGYHSLGNFISGIAALPRIVTLHDFSLSPINGNPSLLNMTVVAKTYRYNDRGDE